MRSHLTARSARLVLAVTATVALAAGLTACGSDDDTAASGQGSTQPASATTGGTGAPAASSPGTPAATTNPTGSTGTTTGNSNGSNGSNNANGSNGSDGSGNSNSSGASGTSNGSNGSNTSGGSGGSSQGSDAEELPAREFGDPCRTGDLDFSVSAGEGGYLLVTARAQNHIECRLGHDAPQVVFNSSEKTRPYPAELLKLTPPDTILLSGTTAAYAVLIPNTTRAEDVVDVDTAEISLNQGESAPAFLTLPGTHPVSESSITAWYPTPEAATPDAN